MSHPDDNDFLPAVVVDDDAVDDNATAFDYYAAYEEAFPGFDMSVLKNLTDEEYMEVVSVRIELNKEGKFCIVFITRT